MADEVCEALCLDRLLLVPAAQPPHKPAAELAPAAHRYRMTALAVRELGMTPAEAVHAATAGGAAALDRDDVGALVPGRSADLVLLDAPTHVHLAYRPGVPLVSAAWIAGRPV